MYGHCAEVVATDGRWLKVRGADGYDGWMHEGFTAPCENGSTIEWAWDIEGEISMGCSIRDARVQRWTCRSARLSAMAT